MSSKTGMQKRTDSIPPIIASGKIERLQLDPRQPGYLVSHEDHASRKDWDPMEKLHSARREEHDADGTLRKTRRQLQAVKVATSKQLLKSNRLNEAAEYKAKVHKEKIALESVQAASDEQVRKMSEMLNKKLVTAGVLAGGDRSWWKLFMLMDEDKAGVVAFENFQKLMRVHLEVGEKQAPDELLRAVWKALDFDATGWITSQKWGPFMKRGQAAVPRPGAGEPTWKERLSEQRKREKAAMDEEMQREKNANAGVTPAALAEVVALAARMHRAIVTGRSWTGGMLVPRDVHYGVNASVWYRLFKKVDKDDYGVFSFSQLMQLVRHELLIDEAEWPEARMRTVWAALVAGSANGYLPAGKFGTWMRSGEPSPERLTTIERRRIMAMRARRELDRETGRLVGFESEASARSVRQCRDETTVVLKEIKRLRNVGKVAAARPQSARTLSVKNDELPEALQPQIPDTPWMCRPATARGYGRGKGECAALFQ